MANNFTTTVEGSDTNNTVLEVASFTTEYTGDGTVATGAGISLDFHIPNATTTSNTSLDSVINIDTIKALIHKDIFGTSLQEFN